MEANGFPIFKPTYITEAFWKLGREHFTVSWTTRKKKKVHKFIAPDIEVGEAYLVHMLYGEHSRLRKISTIQIIFEDDLPKVWLSWKHVFNGSFGQTGQLRYLRIATGYAELIDEGGSLCLDAPGWDFGCRCTGDLCPMPSEVGLPSSMSLSFHAQELDVSDILSCRHGAETHISHWEKGMQPACLLISSIYAVNP